MRIGSSLDVAPVLLAPMAAVTDLPFRTVCEALGVGLTITEFLSADALTEGANQALVKLPASLEGRPFGVQIYGRTPARMAEAARLALRIGAALVDINMGCPKKRVVDGVCGSALMREPLLAQSLVRALRDALPAQVPVTVKHRAGWDEHNRNAPEFACAMVEAGAEMITVHGRTRTQGFSGQSDRAIIRAVRDAVPAHVPVIGNGDVRDADDYSAMRAETGCDAVMIGRGALGNPWLFRAIRQRLAGEPETEPSAKERLSVFQQHVALILDHAPARRRVQELRKAVAWYTKGARDSAPIREQAWKLTDPSAIQTLAESFLAGAAA